MIGRSIALGGTLVELLAAVVVGYHVLRALASIVRRHNSDEARLIIADGVLAALGFSVAGTLLKTIALQDWPQIRAFAVVFVLRTVIKRVFLWERVSISKRSAHVASIR